MPIRPAPHRRAARHTPIMIPHQDDPPRPASPPLRIFLVEDSQPLRHRLMELLAVPGEVEIVGFADTEEASLKTLSTERIDVAIVDLNLRSGSGFGVIKALRAQYRRADQLRVSRLRVRLPPLRRRFLLR